MAGEKDAASGLLSASNPYLAAGSMLADAVGGGTSSADGQSKSAFDSSGWNVNFGGGAIDSKRNDPQAGSLSQYMPYVMAAVGLLVVWRMTKR